jgi:hypothetical protein
MTKWVSLQGFSTHAWDVYSPIGLIGLILMKFE